MNGSWRAYFELLRLPAVFTAVADVMMGYLVTRGDLRPAAGFAVLATISALLYLAGMVLNDVFDAEFDARRRPERPIPSGRIGRRRAAMLGWSFLVLGVLLAIHFSNHSHIWRIAAVATALAGCIVLYDLLLKRTYAGPIAMGACRMLNVLLGMSFATAPRWPFESNWTAQQLAIATGIGVYVAGLTLCSKSESRAGGCAQGSVGVVVMLFGLLMLAISGRMILRPATKFTESNDWWVLWFAIAVTVLVRWLWAMWKNTAGAKQVAVRSLLRTIIVIDAAITLGFCGVFWGCAVLLLLAPMLLMEQWFSTT